MKAAMIPSLLCGLFLSVVFSAPGLAGVPVEEGMVQPRRSIGKAIEAAAAFLCLSDDGYEPGRLSDASTPGYLMSALVNPDGSRCQPKIAYPARHHAYFIRTFLRLYGYTGDASWVLRAKDLADWNIENCTDTESRWPHLPWSTYNDASPGGGADGDAIEPDKAAFIGIAYLELYDATGESKYLDKANRIADTLFEHQQPDGTWPFRPYPNRRYVMEWYGGAPVFYVEFLDSLARDRNDEKLKVARGKVFDYMMKTNIEQGLWGTYHEDIHPRPREYLSSEPICFTALWLFRHGQDHPDYIGAGWKILEQIHGVLVHYRDTPVSPAPAVTEQSGCDFVMPGHTARYSSALAELYRLTGNEKYRRDALSGMNGTTHMQTDHGLFRTWIWDPRTKKEASGRDWYSQHLYTVYHMLDTMPRLPELAPADENHLLGGNVRFRSVRYSSEQIAYETSRESDIVARLIAEPRGITFNGKALPKESVQSGSKAVWYFDTQTGVLTIRHAAGKVEIALR